MSSPKWNRHFSHLLSGLTFNIVHSQDFADVDVNANHFPNDFCLITDQELWTGHVHLRQPNILRANC
jgi:hypothetical protein